VLAERRQIDPRMLTLQQFEEYASRRWIQQDTWGYWWTWYPRLPPPVRPPRPLPDRVKCARDGCPTTFPRQAGSPQRYHTPACQQRARWERRHTPQAIHAKAEYDHHRYLRLKPQLNCARTEHRRRKRLQTILAMLPGKARRLALRRVRGGRILAPGGRKHRDYGRIPVPKTDDSRVGMPPPEPLYREWKRRR
jgi:hypothetical protein